MKIVKKPVYLIDMDGTLYHGSTPIDHAKEFIQYLQNSNRKFAMITNCPGSSAIDLVKKLIRMGIEVDEGNILTSGQATASYISDNKIAARVYLIGNKALEAEMLKKNIQIVNADPDYVVVGYDKHFNYEKMKKAVNYILGNAKFIVTNNDYTIPDGNTFIPHTGAIAICIEKATGINPLIIGKPEKYMLEAVQMNLGCNKDEQCIIIGDRLDTDIAMGIRHGIPSYLVMTGVTSIDLLKKSSLQPERVFNNLLELMSFDKKYFYR